MYKSPMLRYERSLRRRELFRTLLPLAILTIMVMIITLAIKNSLECMVLSLAKH